MDPELNQEQATTADETRATTGLVMCGGEGTRLRPAVGDTEKPLVKVGGEPMIDRVVSALQASSLTTVAAAVSPATPETAAHLAEVDGVECITTAGEGYVADLGEAVAQLKTPTVTVAADLPLVTAGHVDRAAATAGGDSLSVCVPAALTAALGVSAETTTEADGEPVVPTGLNVVGDGAGRTVVWVDDRLAFNINRPDDRRAVERWLDRTDQTKL
ncbi:NTP transferase domain-containing protein [Halonotius sp. GCM10025705]|uniref:NTP transferase domain-containing protein n=1 Tax=Halonotius sp. GCM10025705 TaxID=3252678 RepID=UPI003616969B